jgi:4-amino-4-deoxy-L-arabinose transferase-like glycosyltransferase
MAAQPNRPLTRSSAGTAPRARRRARTALRALVARVPRAAWACALVAVLNAAAWGVIVPAFQVPDEQSHYAYVEYLVQKGRPPAARGRDVYSSSERAALDALRYREMRFQPEEGAVWSAADQSQMKRLLARDADRGDGNGSAREVGSEPPLYYALEAVPYAIASGGTVLDRLQLMRLLSALLAGVTVLFVYLFLREALPALPETWRVGALGVAFLPMFTLLSGGVNSDALLYATSAALFYALARAFRRGLTRAGAIAIGAALGAGLTTKFNALGLVPGTALALVVLGIRHERALRPRALALPALALAVAAAPVLLEMALNASVWDRPVVGATASNYRTSALHPSLGETASYLWQFYLVPLPGMTHYISAFPLRDDWVRGFVGWFGWLDGTFPPLVYDLALVPLAAIALLAGRTVVRGRDRIRARGGELLSYGVLALGLMAFVALASYISYLRFGSSVAQTRYLFPLLPLYGGLLALAARGAGRRWAPLLGTAIVVLAIAHGLFGELTVLARYYA